MLNDKSREGGEEETDKMEEVDFYLQDLESKFKKINPSDYYLAYSGGKDSHLLLWFIKEYLRDNEIKIVSCNTYLEHREIFKRMCKHSDVMLFPALKPSEIKAKYGIPCFTKSQDEFIRRYQNGSRSKSMMERVERTTPSMFNLNKLASELTLSGKLHKVSSKCCDYLKKEPFKRYEKETGKKPILGVRMSEGLLRKSNYTSCFTKDKKFTPIFDLPVDLLRAIYEKYEIEIPKVYEHVSRTGCMGCPYGFRSGNTQKELQLLSGNQLAFVKGYFKESYEVLMGGSNDC